MPSEITFGKTISSKGVADAHGGTLSQISEIAVLPVGNNGFCVQD